MFADKKGLIESELGKVIIFLLVLAAVIIIIAIFAYKGSNALSYIKNLFRFG